MPFTLNDFYKVTANDACTAHDGYKLLLQNRITILIRPSRGEWILGMENLETGGWFAQVVETLEGAVARACEVYSRGWGKE